LDLIPITNKVNPPIYKLGNLGKIRYQQEKERHKQRLKQTQDIPKGIQIGFNESNHDLAFKIKKLEKFLEENRKVEIVMKLKGREKAHRDLALEKFNSFLKMIKIPYRIVQDLKIAPNGLSIMIHK